MLGLGSGLTTGGISSEWTPNDISSLIHWYKFDTDVNTFYVAGASNYVVTEWSDQKGTNHIVDTMTPANTSAYNTNHPKQDQSTKEIVFDHGGDLLDLTSHLSLGDFAIYLRVSFNDFGDFIFESPDGSNFLKIQTSSEARMKMSGARHDFSLPITLSVDTKYNVGYERVDDGSGTLSVYINNSAGTQDGTGDGTEALSNTLDLEQMGNPATTMRITEIIICDEALSSSDRELLNAYLSTIN